MEIEEDTDSFEEVIQKLQITDDEDEDENFSILVFPKTVTLNEFEWHLRFIRDYGVNIANTRPSPFPWYQFYISMLSIDAHRGVHFSSRVKNNVSSIKHDLAEH